MVTISPRRHVFRACQRIMLAGWGLRHGQAREQRRWGESMPIASKGTVRGEDTSSSARRAAPDIRPHAAQTWSCSKSLARQCGSRPDSLGPWRPGGLVLLILLLIYYLCSKILNFFFKKMVWFVCNLFKSRCTINNNRFTYYPIPKNHI